MMPAVLRIFLAELRAIAGHRQVALVLLVAPFIYALFYPQPYIAEALRDVPISVVDLDGSVASRDLVRQIDATPDVTVARTDLDFARATERVYSRDVSGVLVIPQFFERDLLHGRAAPVVLYADSSYFLVYQRLSTAVRSVALSVGTGIEVARLTATGVDPAVALTLADPMPQTLVPLFNPQGGYATYVLPASFVLIVQQILLMGIGMLEPRRHLGPRLPHRSLLSAINASFDETLGRALAVFAIEMVIAPFYLVVLPHLYGLPRLGAVASILILIVPFLVAAIGFGLVIAALLRSSLAAQIVLAALGMPLFFLAGFAWPMEMMPPILYDVARLIPSTTAIDAFVRLSQFGASWAEIQPQWQLLTLLALGYLVLAVAIGAVRRYRAARP